MTFLILFGIIVSCAHAIVYTVSDQALFQDAWVNCLLWPSVNFNGASSWELIASGSTGSPEGYSEAWIKVDLSALPLTNPALVNSAQFRIRSGFTGAGQTVGLYGAPATWSETTLTCNNRPAVARITGGYLPTAAPATTRPFPNPVFDFITFDVTTLLRSQLTAGSTSLSFILAPTTDSSEPIHFVSKEPGLDPHRLVIDYN